MRAAGQQEALAHPGIREVHLVAVVLAYNMEARLETQTPVTTLKRSVTQFPYGKAPRAQHLR